MALVQAPVLPYPGSRVISPVSPRSLAMSIASSPSVPWTIGSSSSSVTDAERCRVDARRRIGGHASSSSTAARSSSSSCVVASIFERAKSSCSMPWTTSTPPGGGGTQWIAEDEPLGHAVAAGRGRRDRGAELLAGRSGDLANGVDDRVRRAGRGALAASLDDRGAALLDVGDELALAATPRRRSLRAPAARRCARATRRGTASTSGCPRSRDQ